MLEPPLDSRMQAVEQSILRCQGRRDGLLSVLHAAQQAFGHLSRDVLWHVARALKVHPSHVYGVATFYHLFSLKPQGKHQCVVCTGTACHFKGAPQILRALDAELQPSLPDASGESATLKTLRCVGACDLAPLVIYDGQVAGHQTAEQAVHRIQEWRADADQ